MDNLPRIALLGTFVGRGRERQVGEICAAQGAFYTLAAPATGTAASEVLQVLGIGETSRTLTLSLVPAPLIPRLRQELRDRLFMTQPGQGILFTVPLSGINARSARWPPCFTQNQHTSPHFNYTGQIAGFHQIYVKFSKNSSKGAGGRSAYVFYALCSSRMGRSFWR